MAGRHCQRSERLDTSRDGSLMTLEDVRRKYPKAKPGMRMKRSGSVFFQMKRATGAEDRSLAPYLANSARRPIQGF